MKSIPFSPVFAAIVATAATIAAVPAQARTSFDGPWSVVIMTQSGACDSGSGFAVQIRDGAVLGYGGFDVRGHVAGNGAVQVQVSSGDQSASGSGRLSRSSGGGSWRGVGSRGVCTGHWTASRR